MLDEYGAEMLRLDAEELVLQTAQARLMLQRAGELLRGADGKTVSVCIVSALLCFHVVVEDAPLEREKE